MEYVGAEELSDAPPAYDTVGYTLPPIEPAGEYGVQGTSSSQHCRLYNNWLE